MLPFKSYWKNVLRATLNLRDRKIMWESCHCPRPEKCVHFSYISQENLKLGQRIAYNLRKNTPIENFCIKATYKRISPFVSLSGLRDKLKSVCLAL